MANWTAYQKTMRVENICFDLARRGDKQVLIEILSDFSDIDEKNSKGYSLLMLAAYHGHLDLTEELIARGADINSCDHNGNSILMGVAFKGHTEIFKCLISAGANIDYKNPKSQTALQFAEMFSRREIVKILKDQDHNIFRTFKAWSQFLTQRKSEGAFV